MSKTDWEIEQEQRAEANRALAMELKSLLNGVDIKLNPRDFEIHLAKTPHGIKAVVIVTDERDRYKVRLEWPEIDHRSYSPEEPPKTTVAKDRPIVQLVKAIQRKLLANYDALWDAQVARAQREIGTEQRRQNVVREFYNLAGHTGEPYPQALHSGEFHGYEGIQKVRVLEDGNQVLLETTYLPVEAARQVIKLVRELKAGQD